MKQMPLPMPSIAFTAIPSHSVKYPSRRDLGFSRTKPLTRHCRQESVSLIPSSPPPFFRKGRMTGFDHRCRRPVQGFGNRSERRPL